MIALTPRGKKITEAFYAEVSNSLQRLVAHLPPDDRRQFEDIAFNIIMAEQVPAIFGDSDTSATHQEAQ